MKITFSVYGSKSAGSDIGKQPTLCE